MVSVVRPRPRTRSLPMTIHTGGALFRARYDLEANLMIGVRPPDTSRHCRAGTVCMLYIRNDDKQDFMGLQSWLRGVSDVTWIGLGRSEWVVVSTTNYG